MCVPKSVGIWWQYKLYRVSIVFKKLYHIDVLWDEQTKGWEVYLQIKWNENKKNSSQKVIEISMIISQLFPQ